MTRGVILALLAESPPLEIRLRERFHRFANGLYRLNYNLSLIVQSIANVALCNNCDTLNPDVAFSPNVISGTPLSHLWLNLSCFRSTNARPFLDFRLKKTRCMKKYVRTKCWLLPMRGHSCRGAPV